MGGGVLPAEGHRGGIEAPAALAGDQLGHAPEAAPGAEVGGVPEAGAELAARLAGRGAAQPAVGAKRLEAGARALMVEALDHLGGRCPAFADAGHTAASTAHQEARCTAMRVRGGKRTPLSTAYGVS